MANEITTPAQSLNVFVTGATNVVGRAVVRQLAAAGHRVFGTASGSIDDARLIRADGGIPAFPDLLRAGELRSAMQAANADVVVNLAPQNINHGLGSAQWNDAAMTLMTHGTQALMEAATAAEVRYVVHTSYLFAGGHDDTAAALIDAARTGEQLVLGCSTPGCVLRFGFLYGAEQPELAALRDGLKMGRGVSGGDPHAHAWWLHAADAARAVLLAVQVQPERQVIDVAAGSPASPFSFLDYFAEAQGLTRPARGNRPSLAGLLFGTKPLDVSAVHVEPDTTAAQTALGWTPRFPDYRQGIDDMLLTWRAQGAQTN
jgi:nucleoside-diphosphate-sugar epimerase